MTTPSGPGAIRDVVVNYLTQPPVPGLQNVFRAQPVIVEGTDWAVIESSGWGAAAYLHISVQAETRIAFGGSPPGGLKERHYDCGLVLLYRWVIPGDGDLDGEADGWVDPYDQLIADVCTRMRADRTFGNGPDGPVWQAAEGSDDLRIEADLPRVDDGQVIQWSVIEFQVVEIVHS